MIRISSAITLLLLLTSLAPAQLITPEEGQRQTQVLEQLKKSLANQKTDLAKFVVIHSFMKEERAVEVRHRIFDIAIQMPGPSLETFLTLVLTAEEDAGIRRDAATALGKFGSESSLITLSEVAKSDRTTDMQIGCMRARSSARRSATFAIAELASRFPKLDHEAAKQLRDLPKTAEPNDNEGMVDARLQALYQITREEALLKPFYDRLKSPDIKSRVQGVVAFRFLKLNKAPVEVVQALRDASDEIRSWAALVLGEIRDPETGPALMAIAGDVKEAGGPRCNAIDALGRMKPAGAADLMEKLLTDADPAVPANAAIALYRITGKKVKQFPEGYRVD